jgi:hypothetical protein
VKYLVENGPLHCARVAGHLKEGAHADDHNQGTDNAENRQTLSPHHLAFALTVQQAGMRLRYIKPRCPEQNGKVERSHRVDEEEFWSRSTFESFTSAAEALLAWEHRYNHERFSMALSGITPAEKLATFTTASSPLPSGTASPNPASILTTALDRRGIAAPEPTVQPILSS